MRQLECVGLKCPITGLLSTRFQNRELLLVGQGYFLNIVSNNKIIDKVQLFTASKIHLIKSLHDSDYLIVGGKSVSLIALTSDDGGKAGIKIKLYETIFSDWIWDLCTDHHNFYFLTAHNKVLKTDLSLNAVDIFDCEEKCILYSGLLLPSSCDTRDVTVLSGSVFSKVIIWRLTEDGVKSDLPVLHSLQGHDGVIFSVQFNADKRIICSTSDDRSARLWRVNFTHKPGDWAHADIQLVHSLYGHSARVFRSAFLFDSVVTVGEDSAVSIWNINTGKLERSYSDGHSGAQVWSVTISTPSNTLSSITTGGGDGSIRTWSLQEPKPVQLPLPLESSPDDNPKIVKMIRDKTYILTNFGTLLVFNDDNKLIFTHTYKVLKNYGVMDCNSEIMVLGSLNGTVIILSLSTLETLFEGQLIDGKIFSISLIEKNKIVVNGISGLLVEFDFNTKQKLMTELSRGLLPESKQRWFAAARTWQDYTIFGDRMGSVHVYKNQLRLVQTFKKLHGRNGVTDIQTLSNSFLTCGRDGTVRRFIKSSASNDDHIEELSCVQTGVDWVARSLDPSGQHIIMFHGSKMIIKNIMDNRILADLECGGGHRSWDVSVKDKMKGSIIYIKDKQVFKTNFLLQRNMDEFCGSHSQTTKTITAFRVGSKSFIATGSDDTLIKIFHVSDKGEIMKKASIKGHLSNIKCLESISISENEAFLISGGGRAQIKVWLLRLLETDHGDEIVVTAEHGEHTLHGCDKAVKQPWRQVQSRVRADPETRLMSLAVDKTSVTKHTDKFRIYVGCSDSVLRVYDAADRKVELTHEIEFQDFCILCTKRFTCNDKEYLTVTTTAGYVHILSCSKHFQSNTPPVVEVCKIKLHQSGVNCIDIISVDDTKNEMLMVTGGDDCSLVVSSIKVVDDGDVVVAKLWREDKAHAAQITAVLFSGKSVLSFSVDQRVCVWKEDNSCDEKGCESENKLFKLDSVKCSNIADIHSACFINNKNLLVCIGIGIEIFAL